ncbi:hypothetical protein [Streptococcus suis]|uniref:hypothetical protein n=1 Tax=Streptococcus suis TaxID=1307 RepID=UPI000408A0F2|nr:hypothetical protein [Streptococcus suis]MDW8732804.1 hypothetical protein [Streptococcus suis]
MTGWELLVPLTLLGLALLFFQKEKLVRYVFLPTYLFMIVGGMVNMVMAVPVWFNLMLVFLPAMAFWIGTAVLLVRRKGMRKTNIKTNGCNRSKHKCYKTYKKRWETPNVIKLTNLSRFVVG